MYYLLPPNLSRLSDLAAPSGRYSSLAGVRLEFNPTSYRAEVCDGKYLLRVDGPLPDAADYPAPPAIVEAPNSAMAAIVGAKDWKAAFRAVPKPKRGSSPVLSHLALVPGERTVTLGATDGTTQAVQTIENVDGRWPQTDQVFPKDAPVATVKLDVSKLAQLAAVLASILPDDGQTVTLELHGDSKPIQIKAETADGQKIAALLMPMSR